VAARADNLSVGMTLKDATTTLDPKEEVGLALVSSTTGADGKLDVYRTTVLGGYPDVWLTFYNGELKSWTVMPNH